MLFANSIPVDIEEMKRRDKPLADAMQRAEDAFEGVDLIRTMRARADGGHGITAAELSRRLGVKPARISAAEKSNGLQGPTYGFLKRVARACNLAFVGEFAIWGDHREAAGVPARAAEVPEGEDLDAAAASSGLE